MVISVLEHGLGNQLFQYAAGRALSARLRTMLLLDAGRFAYTKSRSLDLTKFRVRARVLPNRLAGLFERKENAGGLKRLTEKVVGGWIPTFTDGQDGYHDRLATARGSCRLDGFWQSEKYFREIRPALLEELEPREPLPEPLQMFVRRVSIEESVAVHVRRGDVAGKSAYAKTHGALAASYYAEAIARFTSTTPDARFYVFSDDPGWCGEHLAKLGRVEIVSGNVSHSAVHDLTAMKHCRHFVTGNSTFSWWPAWLGTHPAKRVLAPARFLRVPGKWEKDLRPPEWETMEPTFEEP